MPKRTDIKSIMIIGSGPIVIGQACEFDYSGVQACKALKAQGYRVVLVNSNPATIMTDPQFADATYIEPLTVEICEKIIALERPDALLPTVGGQTALNLAVQLQEKGLLQRYGVELIGATLTSIQLAEDRQRFNETMTEIGLKVPNSKVVNSVEDALDFTAEIGFPTLIRHRSPWAGRAAASPTTKTNCVKWRRMASIRARSARCSWTRVCSAGKNTNWN